MVCEHGLDYHGRCRKKANHEQKTKMINDSPIQFTLLLLHHVFFFQFTLLSDWQRTMEQQANLPPFA